MLFMTDQGRVYRLKGYQVPEGSRTAKGSHIVNLLQLQEGEKVTLMLQQSAKADEDNTYLTMVTRQGLIKRTPLSQFRNIRKAGPHRHWPERGRRPGMEPPDRRRR